MQLHHVLFVGSSLLALALHGSTGPSVIDPTTGLPALEVVKHAPPEPAAASTGAAIQVLWDTTHGVEFGYDPSGLFFQLATQLAGEGFQITTTTAGIENIDLSPYKVIVLCIGSAWYGTYTESEALLLKQYVRSGGGLLLMADNKDVPKNLGAVLRNFNTVAGDDTIQPLDLVFTDFADHPIFEGVQSIYYRAAGSVKAKAPATEVAFTDLGEPVVVSVPGPRVVVLGDINVFDNTYKSSVDNALFASNVFRYLAGL